MKKRKNRANKFGYRLVGTQVIIQDEEAQTIRDIFNYCISGLSSSQILEKINATPIRYYEDGSDWIRTYIILLLNDETYKGTEKYPQIITSEIFDKAKKMREEKKHIKTPKEHMYIEVYREKIKCGLCGSKAKRISGGGIATAGYICSNEECECNKTRIKQRKMEDYLKTLFVDIVDGYRSIECDLDVKNNAEAINEVKMKTNELRLKMQDSDIEINSILDEIRNVASMRFETYTETDNSVQTKYIIDTLQKEKNNERISAECINKVVKRIWIESDKNITVMMLNGKKFTERMAKV